MQLKEKIPRLFADSKNRIIAFDRASKRNQRITYYIVYTGLFCLMAFAVYFWFIINNKSFIWQTDGLPQHYNSLVYFGDYLRTVINGFFKTGTLSFPMWDFHIGYGSDILTTLNYYVIGDPLDLFSVFFKGNSTEILYGALIILRLYLAGIACSAYFRKMGKSRFYTLIGVFIYIFCGYSLFSSVRHPYFINPMIYLPILLIGVERILEKGKPYLMIIIVCISAISNFYFFYMLSILTAMYAVFRFITYYKENRVKQFFSSFIKFCGLYGVGLLLSAFVFLPVILSFINCGRLQSGYTNNFLYYPLNYYLNLIPSYITVNKDYFYNEMGYTSVALIAIILMFCSKKKYTGLKFLFIVLTLFLFVPIFGFIFNGFSYICNRWNFGYSLLISFITVEMLPEIFMLDNRKKKVLAFASIILAAFCVFYRFTVQKSLIFGIFIITLLIILIFDGIYKRKGENKTYREIFQGIVLILALSGIVFNAAFRYSPEGQGYVDEFIAAGKGIEMIEKTPNAALKNVKDDSFYRVETDYLGTPYVGWEYNDSMQLKFNGTNAYFSILGNSISQFYKEIGGYLDTNMNVYQFGGMDDRVSLSALAGVKYYTVKEGREAHVPYGFKFLTSYNGYKVYQNENTLPLGFTYSNYITREDYEKMAMDEKQQALLQGVVLDDPPTGYEKVKPVFNNVNVPYDVKCGDGVSFSKGNITVTKANAEITLTFKGVADSETYLAIKNLWYDGKRRDPWNNPTSTDISVTSDKMKKNIKYNTPKDTIYYNIHDFMANMGYDKEGQKRFILSFSKTGKYTFNGFEAICIPMNMFSSQISSLNSDPMENISVGSDHISGEADLKNDKILFLSIPYNKGWSAKVNGEDVKILKANTLYMAIPLKAGKNTIELDYSTFGLNYGAAISGLTLIVIIGFGLYVKIKKRKTL